MLVLLEDKPMPSLKKSQSHTAKPNTTTASASTFFQSWHLGRLFSIFEKEAGHLNDEQAVQHYNLKNDRQAVEHYQRTADAGRLSRTSARARNS